MESQKEIYEALLDGKTLVHECGSIKRIDLLTGFVVDEKGIKSCSYFDKPDSWSEYKEPQWYDNIRPSSGYPCWLWNDSSIKVMGLVVKYENNKFITSIGCKWDFAETVKPEECYQGVK
jgi:hypothetical protein